MLWQTSGNAQISHIMTAITFVEFLIDQNKINQAIFNE